MAGRDMVVIGASAGGVSTLQHLVSLFPAEFPAAIFIVVHIPPSRPSFLPEILTRSGHLKAIHPSHGDVIIPGQIYVVPPDYHMLLKDRTILVVKGPSENSFRPSIDALFRSAAFAFGPKAIGIVLTGMLNDGVAGLHTIHSRGGITIVQDPAEAPFPDMPVNALLKSTTDHVVRIHEMEPLLERLVREPLPGKIDTPESRRSATELRMAQSTSTPEDLLTLGELTPFTCPECHGTLVHIDEENVDRYKCHTGHGFSSSALLEAMTEQSESLLWQTLRSLQEATMLLKHMANHYTELRQPETTDLFLSKAAKYEADAVAVRRMISKTEHLSEESGAKSTSKKK